MDRGAPTPSSPVRRISAWKKWLFAGVTTAVFFACVEVLLYAVGVRPQVVERDPFVGFTSRIPLFVEKSDGVVETAKNKLPWFNKQEFSRRKAPGTHRIFCLGGSTTYGRPYDDTTSFCGWLRELLPAADSSRKWEVINAGGISYASYRVALVLEELVQYDPDLVIVYTGHNEFLEDRTYGSLKETSPLVKSVKELLSHTGTYSALHALLRRREDSAAPQSANNMLPGEVATKLDQGVGPDAFTRENLQPDQVLEHLRLNLDRIVDIARRAGAEVMLVTPASNLSDCSPFKSEAHSGLSISEQQQLFAAIEQAEQALATQRAEEALAAIDRAVLVDQRYAAAHFVRGRCLEALARYAEARASFIRARDEDICPLRALSPTRQIVIDAGGRKTAIAIDFDKLVMEASPHGIPGQNLFLDHVHPTIEGHRLLALSILDELTKLGIVKVGGSWNDEAIQRVRRTVESRVDREANGKALRNLAKVFAWAGKQEEANRMALQAAELLSADSNTLYLAANALIEQGDLDSAIDRLQQAIAADPNHAMSVLSLGVAHQKKGQLQAAEQQYKRVLELDSNNASAHNNLGAFYSQAKQWDLALAHLTKAVTSNPRYAKAHHNLGVVRAKQRNWTKAIENLRKAIEIDPDFARAHADLGSVYESQGIVDKAVFHYRQALRLDPKLLMTANSLAWILATARDDNIRNGPEALQWALRCAEGTGFQNPGVFNTLAAAYADVGDFENAMLWQTKALQQAPAPMKAMCQERIELYRSERPLRE